MCIKITKTLEFTLRWIKDNQPIAYFPSEGPNIKYVRKLYKEGLVVANKELIPHPKLNCGIPQYLLSKEGRKLLKSIKKKGKRNV